MMTKQTVGASFQVRLVALISIVLVLVTVVIGAVTVTLQNDSLVRRVDEQLAKSMALNLGPGVPDQAESFWVDEDGTTENQRIGALNLIVVGGKTWEAQVMTADGNPVRLDQDTIATLLASVHEEPGPYNIYLGELGMYRVLAQAVTDGENDGYAIVGQSLSDVARTTRNLVSLFALTALAGILVASVASAMMVRRTLRPLRALQTTAATISETPLTSGVVTLPERVTGKEYVPGTEVGDLAESFNQMMDHVEHALVHREQSEEKLKRFAADAGHELRTPLATVSGYAEFAQRHNDELPEDVRRSLDRIRSESKRMASIVENLLLLARLDAGEVAPEGSALVAPIILECVSDARVTGADKFWRIEVPDDAAHIEAAIPEDALRQALTNLITNARLHTPEGTTVCVSLAMSTDAQCVIRVEDDGPGIPPDLAQTVFDRFVRGDAARSPLADTCAPGEAAPRSTGLGLSITEQIIRNSGGTVTLDSIPGRTVFSIWLPVVGAGK